jgi:hypothetical protein
VEKLMSSVKGFVSYAIVRSEDGGFTVTVCNDKAGADESVEKARDWIAKNAAGTGVAPPHDLGGTKHPRFEKRAVNAALVSPIGWASGLLALISSGSFPYQWRLRSRSATST